MTGIVFGLLPALKSTRVDLTPALKDGAARPARRAAGRCRHLLVVSQLALASSCIAVAALLVAEPLQPARRSTPASAAAICVLVFTLDSHGTPLTSDGAQRRTWNC